LRAARALRQRAPNPALEAKILDQLGLGEGGARFPAARARFAYTAPCAWLAGAAAAALLALPATRLLHQQPSARPRQVASSAVPTFLPGMSRQREPFERKRERTLNTK